ncbi:hypothetical protein KF840_11925 [bacterium]|nr:hypothetical protein [bacterium]
MGWRRAAAGSPITWLLALAFLGVIELALRSTDLLWRPTASENDLGLFVAQVAQSYQVARRLYGPPPAPAGERVVILGDSRIWFGAQAAYVERELRRQAPGRDVRVEQLAIFGARIGDLAALGRQLARLRPSLIVIAVDGIELLPYANGGYGQWPQRIFDTGAARGSLAPGGWQEQMDRWARTVSWLYRFRLFGRMLLTDRLLDRPATPPLPDHFESTADVHRFLHGDRAPAIEAAYQAWRAAPTLDHFVAYLRSKDPLRPIDRTVPRGTALAADSPALRGLGELLDELTAVAPVIVLLGPENPLLDADAAGRYHEPGFSDAAAARIAAVAAAHGARVVDGRRWLPADAFFDFLHPFPDVSGLQGPLATEILHGLGS